MENFLGKFWWMEIEELMIRNKGGNQPKELELWQIIDLEIERNYSTNSYSSNWLISDHFPVSVIFFFKASLSLHNFATTLWRGGPGTDEFIIDC